MKYSHQAPDTETCHAWKLTWDELKDLILDSIEDVPDGEVVLMYSGEYTMGERSVTLRVMSKDKWRWDAKRMIDKPDEADFGLGDVSKEPKL